VHRRGLMSAAGAGLCGLQMVVTQGLLLASVGDAAPRELRGTAFGIYDLAVGVVIFVASSATGAVWMAGGPRIGIWLQRPDHGGYCAAIVSANAEAGQPVLMDSRFGGRASMASESRPGEIDASTASSGAPRLARGFRRAQDDELAQMARELERFPVRLIAAADIHLTLVPSWNEISIPEAVGKLRRVADRFGFFSWKSGMLDMVRSRDARGFCGRKARPGPSWRSCARPSSHARANGRAAVSAACHAGPASRQRSRHHA
jgi:hypothetical protein